MVILQKERSENSRSYAVRVLLYNIIHLELQPGTAVSENELSTTLSLSRTPVREALIELNRIGLVEILPQRGSYISKIDYNIVEESRFLRLVTENAILPRPYSSRIPMPSTRSPPRRRAYLQNNRVLGCWRRGNPRSL